MVWLCSHSIVYWVYRQLSRLSGGSQLGHSDEAVLNWNGKRGMLLDELMALMYTVVAREQAPGMIVVHLGGNDWEHGKRWP